MFDKYPKRNELLKPLSGALLFFGISISLASFLRIGVGRDTALSQHLLKAVLGCVIGIFLIAISSFVDLSNKKHRPTEKWTYKIFARLLGSIGVSVFMFSIIIFMVGMENDTIPNIGCFMGVLLIFLSLVIIGIYLKSKR